ncbi:MAG: hypothetical protein KTR31_28795 [Myxococcales bacterium]|nr:hypothetical protein [Myxococcales bacterium]
MLEELKPLTLTGTARRLGVDPFEVVRLLVAARAVPQGPFALSPDLVQRLRELGKIDLPWWDTVQLPADPHPKRQRVRAALLQLLLRKHIDESATRVDNVLRGLPPEEQELLQHSLTALAEAGMLHIRPSNIGSVVSVVGNRVEQVRAIADGGDIPAELATVFEG